MPAAATEDALTQDQRKAGKGTLAVLGALVDKAQRLQQPAVAKYVERVRAKHPDESPEQVIRRLEKHYLRTVTASGGAVGATSAVPGIGTVAALGAITAESALFIEASALLALAIAEVHGISPADAERRKTLVLAVALGDEGTTIVGKAIGAKSRDAMAKLDVPGLPKINLKTINRTLGNRFVRKFTLGKAPVVMGKLIPGGIGAVIGGVGNRALGSLVLRNAREAFGPPPRFWDLDGEVVGLRSAIEAG
ncbi:membrane protein [Gordonia phthalatica]|uniref:Membrane protein n=1 Tax=Gordonia phthalatica TaxID=1136941 RepID=A0A0N7FVB4_9ACTN|nr:membrane protein [Gordonia phthalatica]